MGTEWVGVFGGIFGAVLGGLIGGFATYVATMRSMDRSYELNREIQAQNKRENVRGVLLAIKSEIEAITTIYEYDTNEEWKDKFQDDEPFEFIYDVNQDYFVVFDSNASIIGQIDDDELRTLVVVTYIFIKGLVDSHLFHNKLVREYQKLPGKLRKLVTGSSGIPEKIAIDDISDDERESATRLIGLIMETSKSLKDARDQAKSYAGKLITSIDSSKLIQV